MTKPEMPLPSDRNNTLSVPNTLPDIERRNLLKRLGTAAIAVPVVTVLHDATKNVAHAY
ncbi:hypothetical protein CCP3SC1_530003 [Gammaproteobacteria bacterium]